MKFPKSISDALSYGTVRIETRNAKGEGECGTGFFFDYSQDAVDTLPLIITNRHVVEGAVVGSFLVHKGERIDKKLVPKQESHILKFGDFEAFWIFHPNKDVDLAAMILAPVHEEIQRRTGDELFFRSMCEKEIRDDRGLAKLSTVEDVLMVGYPNGLWDEMNNFPIFRRGITATHPNVDFNGKPIGMVDMACFPGSSGSPICIVNEGSFYEGGTNYMGRNRWVLLGVLFSGPRSKIEGEIKTKNIPTATKDVAVIKQMIHLGNYVKAREIITLAKMIWDNSKRKIANAEL